MKRNTTSFITGLVTGTLLLSLGTTALAASGKVQFNFSNIALNGETKITAGETITAPNGQQVPGSILYVDEAGGKTNYLPIRAVSELLDTKIGYDPATKTVLLGEQSAGEHQHWKKIVDKTNLFYEGGRKDSSTYEAAPAVTSTLQTEEFRLEEVYMTHRKEQATYRYQLRTGRVNVTCAHPSGRIGTQFREESTIQNVKYVTIQGQPAELYQEENRIVLIWQPNEGLLYWITGLDVTEEQLLQVAESLRPDKEPAKPYTLDWTPKGSALLDSFTVGSDVFQTYSSPRGSFTLLVTPSPVAVPQREAETVKLQGQNASYWEAQEKGEPTATTSKNHSSVIITHSGYPSSSSADASVLSWSDPDTGMNFRLVGEFSRDDLLRIAENMH